MKKTTDKKIENEKRIIRKMISVYCKGKKHKHPQTKVKDIKTDLCTECNELFNYASSRIDSCPFMETKTFCSNCPVHCYEKTYRLKIKEVMRYAGPRMIFRSPLLVLHHIILSKKEKSNNRAHDREKLKL